MFYAGSVGFYDRGFHEHYKTFLRLCEEGELIEAGGFKYLKWSIGEQVELWTRVKDGKAEPYFQSYYAGDARMRVALIEKMPRQDLTLSDGAFFCRGKGCAGADWVAGRNPIIFDTPDFHRYDGLTLPRVSDVHLTGLAFRVNGFEDEEAYDEAYPPDEEGYGWDYRHFVPMLMLKPRGEDNELQAAYAEVSGYVRDAGLVTNPVTGLDFCRARLDTIGGEVDIVCSPDKLDGYLVNGGVAVAECFLYGRLAEDDFN
jgi:hypothetical protein